MVIKMKFSVKDGGLFALLFLVELIIAIYIDDSFVRPFVGDVLVIMLIYFFIRTFLVCHKMKLIIAILLFAFSVEVGQYFDMVSILHLQDNKLARIVLGTTFDVMDFVGYSVGALLLMLPDVCTRFGSQAARKDNA